jgi:hypothetical protein
MIYGLKQVTCTCYKLECHCKTLSDRDVRGIHDEQTQIGTYKYKNAYKLHFTENNIYVVIWRHEIFSCLFTFNPRLPLCHPCWSHCCRRLTALPPHLLLDPPRLEETGGWRPPPPQPASPQGDSQAWAGLLHWSTPESPGICRFSHFYGVAEALPRPHRRGRSPSKSRRMPAWPRRPTAPAPDLRRADLA